MALTYVTLTRAYGTGAAGSVELSLNQEITNGGDVARAVRRSVTLDGAGSVSVPWVAANTDSGTTPAGSRYSVTERLTGRAVRRYTVVVPHGAGATVDLATLAGTAVDDADPVVLDSRVDALELAALGRLVPLPPAGQYMFPICPNTSSTSASQGNGVLRLSPWLVTKALRIDRIGAEITTAGEAGSKVRLGIYADTGEAFPGALLLDAGQVAGDAIAIPELTCSLALAPGLYWIGGAAQAAATTQPTLRIATGSWTPPVPLSLGTSAPGANATTLGFQSTGVAGALPATFPTARVPSGSTLRTHVRLAA